MVIELDVLIVIKIIVYYRYGIGDKEVIEVLWKITGDVVVGLFYK